MDTLAIELRLSILKNELNEIAKELPDRRGEIVRYSARILGMLANVAWDDEAANDNGRDLPDQLRLMELHAERRA